MDLEVANTEGSLRYHRFHERLNRSLKTQAIGLGILADAIDSGHTERDIKASLYLRSGWLWGGMPDWRHPHTLIDDARRELGQAGLMRVFSALDVFVADLTADADRWHSFKNRKFIGSDLSDSDQDRDEEGHIDSAAALFRRLGGQADKLNEWPLYRYFRLARNCIVHRDGTATAALSAAYPHSDVSLALKGWRQRTGERNAPELIPTINGEPINFTHRQALSASSVVRSMIMQINARFVENVGRLGMVYLATRHALFVSRPVVSKDYADVFAAVGFVLANRYRVRNFEQKHAVQRAMRELDITRECREQFAKRP